LIDQNQKCKQGSWEKMIGSAISDLTIGVLGFGAIGKKLVELLSKLSFKEILIFDLSHDNLKSQNPKVFGKNTKFVSYEYLLKYSDIISIHIPLTKENYEIVDFNFLNKVKSDLVLINTSRGQIINEDHLLNILDKKLKLVALDVFNKEPYSGPLLTHPKIIATPHIASYTLKSRQEIEIVCLKKAIDVASTPKG
jgi:D-3-phosphoglycerate dehydrogenase